jgi:1-acyl-sn-glycerol-3-phosphate acyltransferase
VTEFDSIRPYRDDEVAMVLRRLVRDQAMLRDVSRFAMPILARLLPPLARALLARRLRRALVDVDSVDALQGKLAGLVDRMIARTTDGFTASGLEALDPVCHYLFVSNHRDIALDSAFVNLALYRAGHATTRMAFGDNLLSTGYAADVMRLNKGFVVERGKTGKSGFAAMSLTSRYIRHSLETGNSVWIAQREGRAKDGIDVTEPALLKMLTLAYRGDIDDFATVVDRLSIVPVAVSYEIDPCDVGKARELEAIAEHGSYRKTEAEDLHTIIAGITGMKGRVHVSFGQPLPGVFADVDALAQAIDAQIAIGFRLFPTHLYAAERSGVTLRETVETGGRLAEFQARLERLPDALVPYVLCQYANPVRRALALDHA